MNSRANNGTFSRISFPSRAAADAGSATARCSTACPGSFAPWRDLPARYGNFKTVHHRFTRWRRNGTIDKVLKALQIRLDKQGKIDWDLWMVDGTSVRAGRAAAEARKKTTRSTSSNRPTTTWAAAAADGAQRSTWLLTARALSSGPRSRRARPTNPRNSTT